MNREAKMSALIVVTAFLVFIVLAIVVAGRRMPDRPAIDLHYFHLRTDATDPYADMGYASMQVKSVAASRHVPVQDVRHLMEEYAINHDGPMIGRERVDVPKLNEALDERWPMK